MHATASTHAGHAHGHNKHDHAIPLWGLFLALLALTAAEVALFEIWHASAEDGSPFIPKFAMVLLLLVFTLPKAAIVMIYFMHLKFEKQFIVLLALLPFLFALIAVLPTLTDSQTLLNQNATYNRVEGLDQYNPTGKTHGPADPDHAAEPAAAH